MITRFPTAFCAPSEESSRKPRAQPEHVESEGKLRSSVRTKVVPSYTVTVAVFKLRSKIAIIVYHTSSESECPWLGLP